MNITEAREKARIYRGYIAFYKNNIQKSEYGPEYSWLLAVALDDRIIELEKRLDTFRKKPSPYVDGRLGY